MTRLGFKHFDLQVLVACAVLGLAAPSQANDPGRPIIIGQSYVLKSETLRDERTINVYAPKGCVKPNASCPVIYLLDGGIDEDFLHVVGSAQVLSENGNARDIIVIGIADVDRRHDLTAPTSVAADLKAAPTSGGSAAYRRFLVSELKPWVADHFPSTGRSALLGESLGGLFTLETLLTAPSDFDDYVVVSPSIWWNDGTLTANAREHLGEGLAAKRLWLDFEEVAPPGSSPSPRVTAYRAQQDALGIAVGSASPAYLTSTVRRSAELHNSIYPMAVFEALRALYPPEKH